MSKELKEGDIIPFIRSKEYKFVQNLGTGSFGVRIDIWTHFMRGCIIDYVH